MMRVMRLIPLILCFFFCMRFVLCTTSLSLSVFAFAFCVCVRVLYFMQNRVLLLVVGVLCTESRRS